MEIPDDTRIKVFNKGIFKGLKGEILCGGHIWPNSIFGDTLLWKNAQKKRQEKYDFWSNK